MNNFDFTEQGRRPTAQQIISHWKKAGRPRSFSVSYGETYATFEYAAPDSAWDPYSAWGGWGGAYRWEDGGNGCRGVNRQAVVKLLEKEST